MTNPVEDMREAAAKAIDHSLCDVAEDCELFMKHRDYFAALVRAIALPEPTPDPRFKWTSLQDPSDATIAMVSAELALTREALDKYAALDPDGARAVLAKLTTNGV